MNAATQLFRELEQLETSKLSGTRNDDALRNYIQNLIPIERVYFDFKEKADARTPKLCDNDWRNLCKAISGFANSSGGVVIWGVEDNTGTLKPIADVRKFTDEVLSNASRITTPSVQGIDAAFLESSDSPGSGFCFLMIPESDALPHRVIRTLDKVKDHYFIQSGSSFEIAAHSQLEDMFGRRPRPRLIIETQVTPSTRSDQETTVLLILGNNGRGIAKYPYVRLTTHAPFAVSKFGIDGNFSTGLPRLRHLEMDDLKQRDRYYKSIEFGSQDGKVLHSGMSVELTSVCGLVDRDEPIDLVIDVELAAEGLPLNRSQLTILSKDLFV